MKYLSRYLRAQKLSVAFVLLTVWLLHAPNIFAATIPQKLDQENLIFFDNTTTKSIEMMRQYTNAPPTRQVINQYQAGNQTVSVYGIKALKLPLSSNVVLVDREVNFTTQTDTLTIRRLNKDDPSGAQVVTYPLNLFNLSNAPFYFEVDPLAVEVDSNDHIYVLASGPQTFILLEYDQNLQLVSAHPINTPYTNFGTYIARIKLAVDWQSPKVYIAYTFRWAGNSAISASGEFIIYDRAARTIIAQQSWYPAPFISYLHDFSFFINPVSYLSYLSLLSYLG